MIKPLKTLTQSSRRALFLRKRGYLNLQKGGKPPKIPGAVAYRGNLFQKKFTGKEPDPETGLYYYGARYLDPKTSRWISGDPALGEYLPVAPVNDEARKHNQNLPGMGGVFNAVNMHAYHYAGNNPVIYIDPDGRDTNPMKGGKTATGYTVTSGYGAMHTPTQTSGKVPHTGIDMVSATREIVATMKGKVIFAGEHPDGTGTATGTLIIIKYDNGEYGLYGHLDKASFNVKAGDEVNEGADLGKYYNSGKEGDNMGVSGGPHLHYGRYKLDDSKKEDKVTNINDFAKSFNATGYFYGKEKVPEDKKIKDGFTSVEPRFDK